MYRTKRSNPFMSFTSWEHICFSLSLVSLIHTAYLVIMSDSRAFKLSEGHLLPSTQQVCLIILFLQVLKNVKQWLWKSNKSLQKTKVSLDNCVGMCSLLVLWIIYLCNYSPVWKMFLCYINFDIALSFIGSTQVFQCSTRPCLLLAMILLGHSLLLQFLVLSLSPALSNFPLDKDTNGNMMSLNAKRPLSFTCTQFGYHVPCLRWMMVRAIKSVSQKLVFRVINVTDKN